MTVFINYRIFYIIDEDLQTNYVRSRKTKIMCSISEKNASYDTIKEMYLAGMNILRFNLAFIDL